MPGPEAEKIELSPKAKEGLEQLVKGHTTGQQMVKRAQIILYAAAGKDSGTISLEVGVSRKTVFNWKKEMASSRSDTAGRTHSAREVGRPATSWGTVRNHGRPKMPTGSLGL
ncbi:helix-turn-helix domain-containing protein [Chloroflexi bacterium TSY]|nr:helix-turn-helix domain-containing protein [Chloroflexi bacterium TSY]MBV7331018.1 helix-turn-helix domain-containing protein [Chloroflexi bacterium TSY]MBV7332248.1 helix-turn-helix domain-containing protein [Chloroflexi bacterium TSY]MBV7335553.1 helix-turn-helix domain-containing protein [Chloroflexi bacterium TSY]